MQRIQMRKAARIYGIPYSSLHRAVKAGEIEAIKITKSRSGGVFLFPSDIEAWIETLKVKNRKVLDEGKVTKDKNGGGK